MERSGAHPLLPFHPNAAERFSHCICCLLMMFRVDRWIWYRFPRSFCSACSSLLARSQFRSSRVSWLDLFGPLVCLDIIIRLVDSSAGGRIGVSSGGKGCGTGLVHVHLLYDVPVHSCLIKQENKNQFISYSQISLLARTIRGGFESLDVASDS